MLDLSITQCILSLGSNYHAEQHLAQARDWLQTAFSYQSNLTITHCYFSPPMMSLDNRPKNEVLTSSPITYLNQIAWLVFSQPILLSHVIAFTKILETQAQRRSYLTPIVSLDIDVLAIKLDYTYQKSHTSHRSLEIQPLLYPPSFQPAGFLQPVKHPPTLWFAISRRLPFASYDKFGINALLTHTFYTPIPILPIL